MFRTLLYTPETGEFVVGEKELITRWQEEQTSIIWLDLQDNELKAEQRLLENVFNLHELAIVDIQKKRHPPKLELFDNALFILLKGLDEQTEDIDFGTIQIGFFIGKRFLVSRHGGTSVSINRLWQKTLVKPQLMKKGSCWIALEITRLIVLRYLNILLQLEPRLDELEDKILIEPQDTLLHELSGYRTNLKKMRRYLTYQVQIFRELREYKADAIDQSLEHEVNDIYEQLERANSLTTLYYELACDLMDSYISLASHHLNNIMKILTIVTVVFVPLTFLAGIYGMNFQNMPELESQHGYYVVLGIMLSLLSVLLYVFRKIKWI